MHTLNSIAQEWMIPGLGVLLVLLLVNFMWVFIFKEPKWILDRLGASDKFQALKFLGLSMGGILFVFQIAISSEINENAEQGLRQERLKNAIEHMGSRSGFMRLGGAYELFHLAEDNQELRQTALDILCAYIRQTTAESEYRKKYKSKPSQAIQSLLSLLFVQDHKVFEGLNINLQGSWLRGAILPKAHLQGAYLQGAILDRAHLQGAILDRAHLQGAILDKAHLQGARLGGAHLQGTFLVKTHLQGVVSSGGGLPDGFAERMRKGIGRQSDLSGVVLEGGLSREDVDYIVKDLSDKKAGLLRAKLERHIDKPASNQLPETSNAITKPYTEEEAEEWIAEYEKAMSEIPKADNGQ